MAKLSQTVVTELNAATEASASVLSHCRNAAKSAAKELDRKLDAKEAIEAVVSTYGAHLTDHNVKANFVAFLTLAYAGDAPVSFERERTVKGKKVKEEVHTTAAKAMDMGKHDAKRAVKEVREDLGIARASGGGRKPQNDVKKPSKVASTANPEGLSASGLALIVADRLRKEPSFIDHLKDVLAEAGYKVTKQAAKKAA